MAKATEFLLVMQEWQNRVDDGADERQPENKYAHYSVWLLIYMVKSRPLIF
jgi:hypothetical protein